MEKQRKWHLFLILAVIALTIYNIFPTIFYYCKPLKEPIGKVEGEKIAASIGKRINAMEEEAISWLSSFCELIQVKPTSVLLDEKNPEFLSVSFQKVEEAARFRALLPRSGSLISFAPAQLALAPQKHEGKEVLVQRKIPVHFNEMSDLFSFISTQDPKYQEIVADRAAQIAFALTGSSESALYLKDLETAQDFSLLEPLAMEINSIAQIFNEESSVGNRLIERFSQGNFLNREKAVQALISSFDQMRDEIRKNKEKLPQLEQLESRILSAENYLKKHVQRFSKGQDPWNFLEIKERLISESKLSFEGKNPFFSELVIDPVKNEITLSWHPDVVAVREKKNPLFEQCIVNEIAKIGRLSEETLYQDAEGVSIPLVELVNASSLLVLDLEKVSDFQIARLREEILKAWNPKHPDLANLKIVTAAEYQKLSLEDRAICFVLYAPLSDSSTQFPHLHSESLYVIAKGIDRIFQHYQKYPDSEQAKLFSLDFGNLLEIFRKSGFVGYHGASLRGKALFANDFLFEKRDFFRPLLKATREEMKTPGTKKYALLELSDSEQRILTENRIDTRIHEDLLKWNDEYLAAQVSLNTHTRFDVPKPKKSLFLSNLALSFKKFFRGDDRKILRWGLDLSGGKTVQIELRDQNGQPVKGELELKQGINELYNRVNKMGVSEISIRSLGHHIVLDFPGSQALSASELIKSSTMRFHIVNEKFSSQNSPLFDSAHRFLQEVWNKAVVLGKKDIESIHKIAWEHLHGKEAGLSHYRSEAAQTLWENGLRLASLEKDFATNQMEEGLSRIAIFREEEHGKWQGQTHPLLIIFHNYALEGANLENIHAAYDPSKGNYLSFDIRGPFLSKDSQRIDPRGTLHEWTSRFSREKVEGTSLEAYSKGRGWRMAVLLNDRTISAPTLDSALKDSAMISGSFSQREVNQLAADLKAGSLTFTPHILSEKNVSPELGKADRMQGILATAFALVLVIFAMVAYYRFAGVVASIAVIFNLLVLWATLQNLGATLTLAGIAGIILTVGMAVDANVLVFERVKEEFAITGRISSAIQAGYKKAFSAIVDSNVTTIIAALILLNFDAGPIKSFAVNLIIGIASSMFTALFMTRYYFGSWLKNPKHKELKMSSWFQGTNYNFLKRAKVAFAVAFAIVIGGSYFVFSEKGSIFGMDFTGGYALNLELKEAQDGLKSVEKALLQAGAESRDFQIRELGPSNSLRVLFGTTMELSGKPFYGLALERETAELKYGYEKNPRIDWVVQSLQASGLTLSEENLSKLDSSWTAMSGQMSESMRNNALIGILLSFISIFIYLAFRFEYKFAAAALICLFHDVLITIGMIGLLHKMGVPVQIDLNTVAALMTIVGYSLNDTIIIFDRIREEMKKTRGKSLNEIVNYSLNVTLSRTMITSGTTLLVLVALVVLGGASIFSFSLVMAVGVFFGTLSSWFIASPLMLFFNKREMAKEAHLALRS